MRLHNIVTSILALGFSAFLFCDDYYTSIQWCAHTDKPYVQALSEQGKRYFKKMQEASQAAHYGFMGNPLAGNSDQVHFGNMHVGMQQGTIVTTTSFGEYDASVAIDPLSVFYLLKAGAETLSRAIDINGHYYREDTQRILDDTLYTVDKKRYKIYQKISFGSDIYQTDLQYLLTKFYELEIAIAACGSGKSAVKAAAIETRDTLQRVICSVEAKAACTQEQKGATTIAALKQTIATIQNTKFKHKKEKKRILQEYQQKLAQQEAAYHACQVYEERLHQQQAVERQCAQSLNMLEKNAESELSLSAWYAVYDPHMLPVLEKRSAALQVTHTIGVIYENRTYVLDASIQQLVSETGVDMQVFTQCYGNQYQQCMHQETLALLDETYKIQIDSVLYQHRRSLVAFSQAACAYNKDGHLQPATTILDFCWSLLSWGGTVAQAAVEGAVAGAIGAVVDLYEHPVHTAVSLLVGSRVMLVYQLSKVVYTVANLGITALVDYDAAQEKWHIYTEPVHTMLAAIRNKEIGLKEAVKAVTQCGMQIYAQTKLLKGLRCLYEGVQKRTTSFLEKNPVAQPQEYLTTPDGQLLKVAHETIHNPTHKCPASCINQYDRLKQALKIEQFTSILKTTKHGIEQLIERGFTPDEVKALYHTPDITKIQSDGANVFIKKLSNERYNVMVINQITKRVVTALKNMCAEDIEDMGNNYGWSLKND